MNMRTNRRVWTATFPAGDICYSGILSTAGGLVFVGRNNQHARRRTTTRTGKLLWTSPKLVASVAAPPMTYTVDGKQYVAVYAGGNGIAAGSGTAKVKYGSDLYTFALPWLGRTRTDENGRGPARAGPRRACLARGV